MKNKIFISMWFITVIILLSIIVFNTKGGDNMAKIKISELNSRTEAADSDLLPIVDTINNETKKITKGNLINDVYSTAEVKTNKRWIDGKPIYRIIVDMGDITDLQRWNNNDYLFVEYNTQLNIDKVTSINAYGRPTNYPKHLCNVSTFTYWDNYDEIFGNITIKANNEGVWYNSLVVKPDPQNSWNDPLQNTYAVVEYTKTTD